MNHPELLATAEHHVADRRSMRQNYFNWTVAGVLVAMGTAWGASKAELSSHDREITRLRQLGDERTVTDIEAARVAVTKQDIRELREEIAALALEVRKLRR